MILVAEHLARPILTLRDKSQNEKNLLVPYLKLEFFDIFFADSTIGCIYPPTQDAHKKSSPPGWRLKFNF